MLFSINIDNRTHNFELGDSTNSVEAYKGLKIYPQTQNYGDLRRLFAHFSWAVEENNPHNETICKLSTLIGASVYPRLNDYQKFYVVNSVTSNFAKARIDIPPQWEKMFERCSSIVYSNMNEKALIDAGIGIFEKKTETFLFSEIPEYSIKI